jgi:hypothetical protein
MFVFVLAAFTLLVLPMSPRLMLLTGTTLVIDGSFGPAGKSQAQTYRAAQLTTRAVFPVGALSLYYLLVVPSTSTCDRMER